MVELFSKDQVNPDRQSSKGNQLKFQYNGIWYKVDYLGYEGLAEYAVSKLLAFTNLSSDEYVDYNLEQIRYRSQVFNGCRSKDFANGWQLITLERLFQQTYGEGVNRMFLQTENHHERLQLLVDYTERATGLKNFGVYMCKMLTIDTLFLNEDRHTHNIAILTNQQSQYKLAPFFDQGASLLSDTTLDYPLNQELSSLIPLAKPKTICNSFDEQLDIAEDLYGQHLHFRFGYNDVNQIIEQATQYSAEVRTRVVNLLMMRQKKYQYLFDYLF